MYYTDFDAIPDASYEIVMADPPWAYKDKMRGHSFSLDHEYQTQPLAWIQGLSVPRICTPDAALLLWVVSPQLDTGIETLKAWGFRYKTVAFCWSKVHAASGKDVTNLGKWTMGNVELCLLGTRGRMTRQAKNVRQLVRATRTTHSAKPYPEIHQRADRLFGTFRSRIELFARGDHAADGWDRWGNDPTGGQAVSPTDATKLCAMV